MSQGDPVGTTSGWLSPVMAAADAFAIAIRARGGHRRLPEREHRSSCHRGLIVGGVADATVDPRERGVEQSVSLMLATLNVTDTAELAGTVRTAEVRDLDGEAIGEVATGIAEAMVQKAEVTYTRGCSATVNDE